MIIYTGGTFDLFHAGHVEFLSKLHRLTIGYPGNHFYGGVAVSLNPDEFVEEFKGKRPVNSFEERKYVLESCKFVSSVVENIGWQDSKPAISAVHPDLVAIGSDWFDRDYLSQMSFDWEWLHSQGIALLYIPRVTPISSTAVKGRIDDLRSPSVSQSSTGGSETISSSDGFAPFGYPAGGGYNPANPDPFHRSSF